MTATGAYRILTGIHGPKTTTTAFQMCFDTKIAGVSITFAFIDDIVLVKCVPKTHHLEIKREVLKMLGEADFRLKTEKCEKVF